MITLTTFVVILKSRLALPHVVGNKNYVMLFWCKELLELEPILKYGFEGNT